MRLVQHFITTQACASKNFVVKFSPLIMWSIIASQTRFSSSFLRSYAYATSFSQCQATAHFILLLWKPSNNAINLPSLFTRLEVQFSNSILTIFFVLNTTCFHVRHLEFSNLKVIFKNLSAKYIFINLTLSWSLLTLIQVNLKSNLS